MPVLAGLTRPYSFVDYAGEFTPKTALEADDLKADGIVPARALR